MSILVLVCAAFGSFFEEGRFPSEFQKFSRLQGSGRDWLVCGLTGAEIHLSGSTGSFKRAEPPFRLGHNSYVKPSSGAGY